MEPVRLPILTERCRPAWTDGLPCCSLEDCPSYDGKRCELMGCRPGSLCEPAVREIVARTAQATVPVERIVRGDRGFIGYGEPVTCTYGTSIEVYESSSAHGPHVWLALKQGPALARDAEPGVAHSHLSASQAREVMSRLQAFLDDIPERWGEEEA